MLSVGDYLPINNVIFKLFNTVWIGGDDCVSRRNIMLLNKGATTELHLKAL